MIFDMTVKSLHEDLLLNCVLQKKNKTLLKYSD